jgi:phosphatidylglycerol:prolipoprotein diacylglycerol transferase
MRVVPLATRTPRAALEGEPSSHFGIHNRVVMARLGPLTLVNFGLLAAVGGALAAWVSLARQEQAGMRPEAYAAVLFVVLPALAVIGSRLFSLALDWREFLVAPWATAFKPGFAFQGGLVGAAVGVVGVAAYAHLDPLLLMDTMALGFPLGHGIGRVACHTYGCCHGRPTRSRLAIRYTNPDSKAVRCSRLGGIPLHPTQLYSAGGSLVLFAILAILASGQTRTGELAATFLILGSAGRFLVEFVRGEPTGRILRLTPFQWVSIGSFTCGLGLLSLASGNPLHEKFADTAAFLESLRHAAFSIYPFLVFAVIFLSFGVQGRRVGSFSFRTSRPPRAPH